MNKYYEMMGHMHMPEEQEEQLRAELTKRAESKRNVRPMWRRYAAAAALALCLLGTAATAYAAVRYYWSDVFFDNGNQHTGLAEDLIGKASTEEVTAQDDNYKFTVRNHLYSKEQQMGLIICSFQFLTEQKTFLDVGNKGRDGGVVLKKDQIIDEQSFVDADGFILERDLHFNVCDESETTLVSANQVYYTGEMTEDGGYLLGIRYSFDIENKEKEMPDLSLILENAGDVEGKLKAQLPMGEDIACIRFVSEKKPEDVIVISPIGMTLTMTGDKAQYTDNVFDDSIMKSLKLVTENETSILQDVGDEYETSSTEKETESAYTWYVQKAFKNLVDVSQIDYIELGGNKYVK